MTDSPDRPRQPVRSDLTAKPGESFGAWVERVRRVAVIDPELADQERRRVEAEDQRRREAARWSREHAVGALRWVLGTLAALGVSVLLFFLAGLSVWIVVACAIASAASLPAYVLVTRQERSAITRGAPGPVPSRHQAVLLTELDETSRELLEREQRAIAEVLSSDIYRGREQARQEAEATLRWNEWQAAANLRALTLRRAQHDAIPVLGRETAEKLDEQRRHLTAAEDAVAANVKAIESLVARVKRAELERSDQENAIRASRLDGSYQDLGAGVAAVELATGEIRSLADKIAPPDVAEPS
jgi:hypothetical protein